MVSRPDIWIHGCRGCPGVVPDVHLRNVRWSTATALGVVLNTLLMFQCWEARVPDHENYLSIDVGRQMHLKNTRVAQNGVNYVQISGCAH